MVTFTETPLDPSPAALPPLPRPAPQEFTPPPGREFSKELLPALNAVIAFLVSCRPLAVSMGNAIKAVKGWVEKMKVEGVAEGVARAELGERITEYVEQKIR